MSSSRLYIFFHNIHRTQIKSAFLLIIKPYVFTGKSFFFQYGDAPLFIKPVSSKYVIQAYVKY